MFEDMEISLSPTFRNGVVSAMGNSGWLENIRLSVCMVELTLGI